MKRILKNPKSPMLNNKIKISTLNLCLGLKNKKLEVSQLLNEHKIDVLCLQETEIECQFDQVLLSISGLELELETNNVKARTGIFVRNNIKYKRRRDLEGVDSNLVIVDIIKVYVAFVTRSNSK